MAAPALDGFAVAVTADRRAGEQIELLRRHGARALHGPTMQTLPIVADGNLRAVTEALLRKPAAIVIANTGIGMRAWLSAADSWGGGEQLGNRLREAGVGARGPKAGGSVGTPGCSVSATVPLRLLPLGILAFGEALTRARIAGIGMTLGGLYLLAR